MPFDTLVMLDFEATCEAGGAPTPQEIIELPSVLLSLRTGQIVDEFRSFVRPVHHPRLTPFCTELTSITQADVDAAPPFLSVLASHRAWLERHGLHRAPFAFVTCGDWDLQTMLPVQCAASDLSIAGLPRAYRQWINVKTVFRSVMPAAGRSMGMPAMLAALGLELRGTHHRGIDDSLNIAQIVLSLAARGATFEITSHLAASRYPPLELELDFEGRIERALLPKRALPTLLGLASSLYRTQLKRAFRQDDQELDEQMLCELDGGARVRLERE